MKIPALFSGIPVSYAIAAVMFGLVMAFGIAAMTYHPLPVQVQINQYAPVKVPEPAIPTIAPVKPKNPDDPFGPAPAPVIVTTQPLPQIKPTETPYQSMCDPEKVITMSGSICMMTEAMIPMTNVMVGAVPTLFLLAIVGVAFGMFGSILNTLEGMLRGGRGGMY